MVDNLFRFFDGDNHYYETRDCFTRYIDPSARHLAIHTEQDKGGNEIVVVGKRIYNFTSLDEIGFDRTVRPGALRETLRDMSSGRFQETKSSQPMQPEYINRDERLNLMDKQGLESAFMFPTLGVGLEHFIRDDPPRLYANLKAFNRYVMEEWGYAYEGRIFAPPILNLTDLEQAVVEVERVIDLGARMIQILPGPWGGKGPGHPDNDAFWQRVADADLAVSFHIGNSGYNELFAAAWGEETNPAAHRQSAFQWTNLYGDRPIMDTVASMIYHNLFGRFQTLRVFSVENGSHWVPYLLKQMDKMVGMGRNGPWPGGKPRGRPSEIFKEHVYVAPYHEEPVKDLMALIGANRVVFGSDFPHSEGLAEPADFLDTLEGSAPSEIKMVMRDNARRLVALPA